MRVERACSFYLHNIKAPSQVVKQRDVPPPAQRTARTIDFEAKSSVIKENPTICILTPHRSTLQLFPLSLLLDRFV